MSNNKHRVTVVASALALMLSAGLAGCSTGDSAPAGIGVAGNPGAVAQGKPVAAGGPMYTAEAYLLLNTRANLMTDDPIWWVRIVSQEGMFREALKDGSSDYNIKSTEWYRKYSANPVHELQEQVSITPVAGGIRVSMTGNDPEEIARIVNAVARQVELRAQFWAECHTDGMIALLVDEQSNIAEQLKSVRNRVVAVRPFDMPMFQEHRSSLFMKIAEETRRIVELRIQEVAARAAVEQAEQEDFRNSPEVLDAIAEVKKTAPNWTDDQAQAVIERIKANRQAILANILAQLRALLMSVEESEIRLKDNEKAMDTLRQLEAEEAHFMELHRRVDSKLRDLRLQRRAEVPLILISPATPPARPCVPK